MLGNAVELVEEIKQIIQSINTTKMYADLEIRGIKFDVEYDHQPEEPPVMYYPDGSGDPGHPETLDILEIKHGKTDFTDFFADEMDEIKDLLWKHIHE